MHKEKAVVLTGGHLGSPEAKTAHGLIRGTDRFEIVSIIDESYKGRDAGEVLDGIHRAIPVWGSVQEALSAEPDIRYCIIGIATVGGLLPDGFLPVIEDCIRSGISIVNGLHQFLTSQPSLVALAEAHHVTLTDIRKQKEKKDLHFWNAEIFEVPSVIIAVIGTDCALGKRTTSRMLMQACKHSGLRAEMVYTGQTGWLQGGEFGFIVDSTLNDFVAGELEYAIVSCWKARKPDVIFLEGQSALRNPSGPCGAEMLVSGNAKYSVLVHAPKRKYYEHLPKWGSIPSLASEIDLIRMYGSEVIALALNTEGCTTQEAISFQTEYEKQFNIPVLLPLQQGVEKITGRILQLTKSKS